MVPEGWKVKQLADVCSKQISYGIVQTGEHQPNGIPCLRVVDLTKDEMHPEEMIRTSVEIHESYRKTILEKDEIVMALRGEVGLVREIDAKLVGANITRGLARISAKPHIVAPEFLLWELRSPKFRADLMRRVGGSALQEISLSELRKVQTLIPSLPEQKKIAKILSTWDKAITTTEQLLANSQQQKKALMQQLLTGKKRLLDKNGVRFSGEWRVSKLSKLFERVTTKNNGQSTNVVTISGQHGLIRQEEFFKKAVASETLDGYFLLKQGQFAYNKSYSNGYPMGAIKRLNRYPDGVVTTLYICFELSDSGRADSDFWEHYFESGLLNKGLSQIAHEGGRAHGLLNVKPSDFFSLKVPTPSFEEQQKIAAVLSTADQEISALQQKLDALKQEKKALMQQLLTGKRRVLV
ncbi:restriction endonuclease subunit S [Shewanella algae]|uniref:restriction endonuclease subunit S n=1 Tax=Shewanella algae TaxID=38313 RepID=UPI001AAD54A1|nr:restriction endonuclease subunit S [Shewanella algae]MBO2554737.1 restriction endonuclease subunit S [Shewanella algae]MBO2571671.1 restriction endonuclease subunit S [Shewanella algae]